MSNRNMEHLNLAIIECKLIGAHYIIEFPKSGSVKFWIMYNGKRRLVTVAKTPSDLRAPLNIRTHVRRVINEMR